MCFLRCNNIKIYDRRLIIIEKFQFKVEIFHFTDFYLLMNNLYNKFAEEFGKRHYYFLKFSDY